jgi:hypothetical protein
MVTAGMPHRSAYHLLAGAGSPREHEQSCRAVVWIQTVVVKQMAARL